MAHHFKKKHKYTQEYTQAAMKLLSVKCTLRPPVVCIIDAKLQNMVKTDKIFYSLNLCC